MTRKKWQLYLNFCLIAFLALGVFSLSLKVLADNSWERFDFSNWHQARKDYQDEGQTQVEEKQTLQIESGYKLPILMYHYISLAPKDSALPGLYLDPEIFDKQLKVINSEAYQSLFMSEVPGIINSQKKNRKYIALTFDDAYEDFYAQAWPRLKAAKIKSTLYVIINKLDQPGYISRDQLKELAGSQMVEIASHTFNHPNLQNLNEQKAGYEIKASRQVLSALSGQDLNSFAYPFGLYRAETLKIVKQAGYSNAVSTAAGSRQNQNDIFSLKRLRPNSRQGEDFRKWLDSWQ
ncbi:MAG: polysaccharide deacetylase family protein [Patescibacteria group bacterium]